MEYRGEMAFFDLQYVDLLKEYEGKLVIDWGGSARMWHQKATTEKPIVQLSQRTRSLLWDLKILFYLSMN